MVLGLADTSSSSKVPQVCPSQAQLPPWMRFFFIQLEFLPFFFRVPCCSSWSLPWYHCHQTYSLTARIRQLCSNGLDGLLIQSNLVVLGGIIPIFLALASGDISMLVPHEFDAIVLGASEFGVLCLHVGLVFERHISFIMIFIFVLGTNIGNMYSGHLGK